MYQPRRVRELRRLRFDQRRIHGKLRLGYEHEHGDHGRRGHRRGEAGCEECQPGRLVVTSPAGSVELEDGEEGPIAGGWYGLANHVRTCEDLYCGTDARMVRFVLMDEGLG